MAASPPPSPSHPPAPSDEGLGLRERKKRATRAALTESALQLVDTHGLAAVTVEQICAKADVSPRTFFNYFASKEEALVGSGPAPLSDRELADFEAGGTHGHLMADLGRVLARHLEDHVLSSNVLVRRHELLHREPDLQMRFRANLRVVEDRLAEAIARRERREPDDRQVRLLVGIVVTGMRSAIQAWAASGGSPTLATHVTTVFDRLDHALDPTTLLEPDEPGSS